jgi:hypothetical protein
VLSPQEVRLLRGLRNGPLDDDRLCRLAALPPDHTGRILADMEWRGLVVVLNAAGKLVAMLTPQGQRIAPA